MSFSILSKRKLSFSGQIQLINEDASHEGHVLFFKDIREKSSDWSHGKSGWGQMCNQFAKEKTVFFLANWLHKRDKYNSGLNARQMLTKEWWWSFSYEETVCLCLHVCVDVQSWCNLVWQVTVMHYYFKNPQQCLNNTIWKGCMGICERVTSLALGSRPCDPAIWLLKWLKWVRGLGGVLLSFSQKLLLS